MKKLNTVFEWCSDVVSVRRFYTDLIGLEETFFDEEKGWLTYQVGETLVVYMRAPTELPVAQGWAQTPAYDGGSTYDPSWVFEVLPEEFDDVVKRLRQQRSPEQGDPSGSAGGRAFFVKDPMGKTVEIFSPA